jgi:16S rRNA (adenine1518-N6/adenine1519-N6)-dimethyltransferase
LPHNLTDVGFIRDTLKRHGFSFRKRLGQNFLINPAVAPRIAALGVPRGVGVLEIGPGIGVLTRELAARADKVAAVEIDGRLMGALEETLSDLGNVAVVNADIL